MSESSTPPSTPASPAPASPGSAPKFQPGDGWLAGIVLAILTYWLFGQTLLNTIPTITADLGLSEGVASLAVPLAALFSGVFIVLFGGFADRFGRVRMLRIGFVLSILGSGLVAITPAGMGALTAATLLSGRVIQGLSIAAIMPAALALIKTYFDGPARQRAVSYFSIGTFGGSGLTSLVGGMVTSSLGWRWNFIIAVVVTLIAWYLTRKTPESKMEAPEGGHKSFDIAGVLTLMVAVIGLNVVLSQGSNLGWLSPVMTILVVVTVLGLVAFLVVERRKGRDAFVPLSLFANARFTGVVVANALINGTAGTLVVTQTIAQRAGGLSAAQAGYLTIGFLVAVLVTIRIGEVLLRRLGTRTPMVIAAISLAIGVFLNSLTMFSEQTFIIAAVIGFIFFGTGLGIFATPATDAAISSVPERDAGLAGAIFKMGSTLGNAIGITVATTIMNTISTVPVGEVVSWAEGASLRTGGSIALWVLAVGAILTAVVALVAVPSRAAEAAAAQTE